MNVLDLFSGIGGFSLGLERAGMRTVAFCEIDPFARAILRKHWPDVPCYEDVRSLTADRLRADGITADVICGGFPCQDISVAGSRAGIGGERSGLWKEYARIIGEVRPSYVIVENVAALLGRGLDVVLGDLAALGYDAEWHCISASAVGAPHRRDRIWVVAYPYRERRFIGLGDEREHEYQMDESWEPPEDQRQWRGWERWAGAMGDDVADANVPGQRPNSGSGSGGGSQEARDDAGRGGSHVAYTERRGLQGGNVERAWSGAIIPAAFSRHCGGGEFGAPWWTEPDVGRVAYGVPAAMDRLKGLGNSVVPQIPEIIGLAIMRTVKLCRHCERFDRLGFECSASTHLECDCPKCQGLCECEHPPLPGHSGNPATR